MIDFAHAIPPAPRQPRHPPPLTPPSSAPEPFPPADLVRLGDEIAELAAHLHAATYRLLVLVREFGPHARRCEWHRRSSICRC